MARLTPSEAASWTGRLVDVRNLDEFVAERLPRAECVPLPDLLQVTAGWDRAAPLLLMCKSGMRSDEAARRLEAAGFTNLQVLQGGIEACKRAGLPVEVNRNRLPIMRQVFIAAGVVLLSGLALALVNPWFLLIPVFAACSMVLAGLTGHCPMAGLLKHMPWNKDVSRSGGSCTKG